MKKGEKFKYLGEYFFIKKIENNKIHTTSGRIFNASILENSGVKFEKDPNYIAIKKPLYGKGKEQALLRRYYYIQELKDLKEEYKQLNMDMEYEAGLHNKKWTDADANRYGDEFNRINDRIEYLEKKIKESNIRLSYANGGNIEDFSDNQRMIMNQNVELEHHHEELEYILKEKTPVPAWIVAKMATATENISDVTHYLDGQKELQEDEEEVEVEVENIVVPKTSISQESGDFINQALNNLKGFLKGMDGINLRDDYTFDYKGEQYEIEPIINTDENGVSNAVFTIFDRDGEEVGEITYSRDVKKQKFTANSEFFGWNNAKFEDGGFMNNVYNYGGHLEAHGLRLGDKIIKTIGSYQKVENKEGDVVYVDLSNGYRGDKEPLPFNEGGKVNKQISEPRIMIMNKYIEKFGTHYGVNLYLLNVKIDKSNEKQIEKYIDEGLSPFEIYEKLKTKK